MNSNFLIKINLDGFQHSAIFSQRNWHFKNIKIVENFKKTQLLFINQHFCMFIKQNLFQNIKNFISGFFPDFPDPVFSLKKIVREVAGGQTKCQFVSYLNIFHILQTSTWWQKLADMKNAKNLLYVVKTIPEYHLMSISQPLSFAFPQHRKNKMANSRFLPH